MGPGVVLHTGNSLERIMFAEQGTQTPRQVVTWTFLKPKVFHAMNTLHANKQNFFS